MHTGYIVLKSSQHPSCHAAYHVTCGFRHSLLMTTKLDSSNTGSVIHEVSEIALCVYACMGGTGCACSFVCVCMKGCVCVHVCSMDFGEGTIMFSQTSYHLVLQVTLYLHQLTTACTVYSCVCMPLVGIEEVI